MTYTADIEALDKRLGRTVTVEDWRRVGEKPAAELTRDDLTIIEHFGGAKALQAAIARRDAVLFPTPDPAPRTKTAPTMADVTWAEAVTAIVQTIKLALQEPKAKIARLEELFAALLCEKGQLRDQVLKAAVERSKSVTHVETLERRLHALETLVKNTR